MTDEVRPARFDYDDPAFRYGVRAEEGTSHSILQDEYRDIHAMVADGLMLDANGLVLDMGMGFGALGRHLDKRSVQWVGIDLSRTRIREAYGDRALGDARRLPFADGTFGGVAALYMLYHFEDPVEPIREAFRVLKPGGLFVACAPSHDNYPELQQYLPPQPREPFDADNGAELIGQVFGDVRTEIWDMHVFRLPDAHAVWTHLVARQHSDEEARAVAAKVRTPLWVRARGAVFWAQKPA